MAAQGSTLQSRTNNSNRNDVFRFSPQLARAGSASALSPRQRNNRVLARRSYPYPGPYDEPDDQDDTLTAVTAAPVTRLQVTLHDLLCCYS